MQNNFQVRVGTIFQSKCVWPDAEDIAASSNSKVLHFWSKKTTILLFDRNKSIFKYCLAKDISKPLTIYIINQSRWHWGWYTLEYVTENVLNVYYIQSKLAINTQIFSVSKVSSWPSCSHNVGSGTEIFVVNLIFIW